MYQIHKILPKPKKAIEVYLFLRKRKIQFQNIQRGELMFIEEENILVETNQFMYLFSIDYVNDKFLIDIYDKEKREYVSENHEIILYSHSKTIYELINKAPGTIIKRGGEKFLIRNHDEVAEHTNSHGDSFNYDTNTINNIYDTRNESNIFSKIPLLLKEAWLKI